MVTLNARSLRNKFHDLQGLVSTDKVDIICITETWLDTGKRDFLGEYHLPGYKIYKRDRGNRAGGGVLIYARHHLEVISLTIDTPHEITGVKLQGIETALRLIVVYRPPKYPREQDLQLYSTLSRLTWETTSIIVGDFNCPLDWSNETATTGEGNRLIDFKEDNFLIQLVQHPTRGRNILDLIFSTDEGLVSQIEVGECLGTSDHHMVFCTINIKAEPENYNYRQKLNLRRANYGRFVQELKDLPLQAPGSIERMWTNFKTEYLRIQALCIPLKREGGAIKTKPRWFNDAIGREIRKRKRLYKTARLNPTAINEELLIAQRRVVKRMVRQSKVAEEHRVALACKDNPKEFYGYVNSRKPIRSRLGPLRDDVGNLVHEDGEMARVLNSYFSSVFTRETGNIIPVPGIVFDGAALETIQCTLVDVEEQIKKMNPNKAAGSDGFLPKVIKAVNEGVAPHLHQLFNRSLETGEVPGDMRIADVTPIYKKGPPENRGNYRPISLTSVIGKLLEGVIKNKIVDHIEQNNLFRNSQHGFRQGRSCLTNLLEFFHQLFITYDQSRAVDIIYLDFQKAFDKVPHKRLLVKINALGIRGLIERWITAWLSNRRQRVVINGKRSGWSPVTSGVPQGSVLGPLLFLIYINDLDVQVISRLAKFADDTKLGTDAADPEAVRVLQNDLAIIGEWSEKWQMPFNLDKCHVLHVGNANLKAQYTLLGSNIVETTCEKDLGVLVSSDFKFTAQCLEAEKRAQKILGYIKRQFQYRNERTVLTLYNALVRPLLEYAVPFWSPTRQSDIARLERVQARATKLIPALRNKGYERRLDELGLFTLEQRRLRGQLIETFKILRGFSRVNPENYFTMSNNPTRNHGFKVVPPRFTTDILRNYMTFKICNVWNGLPEAVVNSSSVESFKRRLDRVLQTLRY